jgi:hypothetical protein
MTYISAKNIQIQINLTQKPRLKTSSGFRLMCECGSAECDPCGRHISADAYSVYLAAIRHLRDLLNAPHLFFAIHPDCTMENAVQVGTITYQKKVLIKIMAQKTVV